jgi:hypothetical protein
MYALPMCFLARLWCVGTHFGLAGMGGRQDDVVEPSQTY